MTPVAIIKSLDASPPMPSAKSKKLKPRRERRKAAREAAQTAKRNSLQHTSAAEAVKSAAK